ncbi:MAG: phosphatidylglycerol lysyltransferase domain-containing protein [Defluviitaleaceae bacterium]|nr:phosphatidylglycerol lysyltransferase domain-containing protein [Defluviitaleaceae bacterium]
MLSFKKVTMDDKDIINQYLSINKFENSEYNFTTIMAWQFVYETTYTIEHDCLLLQGHSDDRTYFYFPLGKRENIKPAFHCLMDYCKTAGLPFSLVNVSSGMLSILEEIGMLELFEREDRRDAADYIYRHDKLVTLSGKKLHGKKNHFNFFNNNYDSRLEPIGESNIDVCEKMLKTEIAERSTRPYEEMNATFMAFRYRDEFGMVARALFADNELVGVILAEKHHDTALIQIAKANVAYRGASVALFQMFLSEHFNDCEYVNFMEDLGLEGLRRAKLSYDPERLIEKSILHLK